MYATGREWAIGLAIILVGVLVFLAVDFLFFGGSLIVIPAPES